MEKSFFRNLVAFFFALILMVKHRTPFRVEKGNWGWMLLRAGFGTLGILCNFYAVDHLLLADASMLNKMSPFFAVVCSVFLLKEKLRLWQGILVGAAFAGSLLVIKPDFTSLGSLPALSGASGWTERRHRLHHGAETGPAGAERRQHRAVFLRLFLPGDPALADLRLCAHELDPSFFGCWGRGWRPPEGSFAITAAYLRAPAREISVYDYSQILFASGLGFLLFGQVPRPLERGGLCGDCGGGGGPVLVQQLLSAPKTPPPGAKTAKITHLPPFSPFFQIDFSSLIVVIWKKACRESLLGRYFQKRIIKGENQR